MSQPLEGFKVLDFTHVMAGPFTSHFLRLLGAEVIKVENPKGDLFRSYATDADYAGVSFPFIGANAGKKSIALNLKSEKSKEICQRLVASCDIVLENFRPGVMEKLGLGYEDCKTFNDQIIYCSISGYGQKGPMRDYPAIDNVVQAVSGMMSVSGAEGDPPMRMGVPVVDTYVGTLAAMAVLSAIIQHGKDGRSQYIDVAMLDASLVLLYGAVMPSLIAGKKAPRTGNTGFSGQPTAAMYQAGDGQLISLGVTQQIAYERMCQVLEREDLITDTRFANGEARAKHGNELMEILGELFKQRPAEEFETLLSQAGVPCGVVRDVPSALGLEQVRQRELLLPITIPGLPHKQDVHVLNTGFQFEHDGPGLSDPPPELGEHTREVMLSLGYSDAELSELGANGVIVIGDAS